MIYDGTDLRTSLRVLDNEGQVGSVSLITRQCWLFGFVITDNNGAGQSTVRLVDGDSAEGQLIAFLQLTPNQTVIAHPGQPGWPIETGLFLDVVSGDVTATFTIGEQVP